MEESFSRALVKYPLVEQAHGRPIGFQNGVRQLFPQGEAFIRLVGADQGFRKERPDDGLLRFREVFRFQAFLKVFAGFQREVCSQVLQALLVFFVFQ